MKLIIFDFEGTLVDFQWKLKESINTMHRILEGYRINYNIPCDTEKFKKLNYSQLYNYFSKNIEDPLLRRKIMNDFNRIYDYYDEDASLRWSMYDEVPELLEELKNKGFKIALDSNVGRKALDKMLKKFMIGYYFDITVTRNDVKCLKPNPEGIFKILNYFNGKEFKEKYFVGDSVTDIKTAKRAKFPVIILTGEKGENKLEEIIKHNPNHVINNLKDMLMFL